MNCPECGGPFVKHGGTSMTLVGYGDGPCGREHDDNCQKRIYVCKNGHRTEVSRRNSCECGWKGKETCFCHAGTKVDRWPSTSHVTSGEKA